LEKPRILDIGCGSGVPTMELARLSHGEIVGIDIAQPSLDRLALKIEMAGLQDRVKIMNCSMLNMYFTDSSFDIIWSEGSICFVGFEKGLREWRRLLKPNGFLAVHDMTWARMDTPAEVIGYWKRHYPGSVMTVPECLQHISEQDYEILGYFTLSADTWWNEYYTPLKKRLNELRLKYAKDTELLSIINNEERDIDIYTKHHEWYGSTYFVMKKKNTNV